MSNHLWIQENLAAYLAGGLTADERTRFEKHCADCVACVRALAAARKMEDAMTNLFTDARPARDWRNA